MNHQLRNHTFKVAGLAFVASASLLQSGCLKGQMISSSPQSHFDFPNSNVIPLGPAEASIPGPSGFFSPPSVFTSESDSKVYGEALSKVEGADLLIDYFKRYSIYSIGPFSWSQLEIEGTAVDMEVGARDLE